MKSLTKILMLAIATAMLGLPVFGQSALSQANREYNALSYMKAAELYEKALKENMKDSTLKRDALIKMANSYRQIRDNRNSERAYRLVIANNKDLSGENINCYLYYAQALASNGKYEEARDAYDKFSKMQAEDQRGKSFSTLYSNVGKISKNATSYAVEYLDINTNRSEFSPTYYKKGLVFVSGRDEGIATKKVYSWNQTAFLDLYELPDLSALTAGQTSSVGGAKTNTKKAVLASPLLGRDEYTSRTPNDTKTVGFGQTSDYKPYQEPTIQSKNMGKSINSKYHEGPVAFFSDGKKILFTRNNFLNGKYGNSKEGINKLKLYSADLVGNDWKNIKELPFNNNDYSTGHPALSKDNSLLYFVSDMPGGMGGTDIYVARYDNGNLSSPLNLGPAINTKGNEMFPFVDDKGNLYFASDGLPGLGQLDIFYAKLIDGVMAKSSKNLGAPINSSKDDFGLITDGERTSGFLSSNRKNGGSDDDIYRFSRKGPLEACQEITVSVFDAESKAPLANAAVSIVNKSENDGQGKIMATDGEGNLKICLDSENDFLFKASNEGYINNNIGFTTKELDGTSAETAILEIPLDKIKPQIKTFTIKGLVTTQKDKTPIVGVKVILRNECDSTIQEAITDEKGSYQFEVPLGCNYTIEALKDNFGTMGSKVKDGENAEANISMFEKGDVIKIENIYYNTNKWDLRPEAVIELDKLVELMNKYPKMKIEFGSHTDSRSSTKYNKTLSTKRAKGAVAYIVKKGILAKRIIGIGYGEGKLVNKCKDGVTCTEEEHQQNRRTEMKIINI
jgi:outer membrane protein OmpA-like peptidoglycan-associated protein/tetratricopeptide (TPR) repeat protein